jgi:hypothetical protein
VGRLGLTLNLFLVALSVVALIALAGAIYQRAGRASDVRRYPPLGCLIDVGGVRLHVHMIGEGAPPVVFEAGIAATSLSWQLVQPEIAKFAQTASYDRAGLGWSGASPHPRAVWQVADELRMVMDRACIPSPRISHSKCFIRDSSNRHGAQSLGRHAGAMRATSIDFQWSPEFADLRFKTGVSRHSHTLHSRELLKCVYRAAQYSRVLRWAIRRFEAGFRASFGAPLDLARGWWTPPLAPLDAYNVESDQVRSLGLKSAGLPD